MSSGNCNLISCRMIWVPATVYFSISVRLRVKKNGKLCKLLQIKQCKFKSQLVESQSVFFIFGLSIICCGHAIYRFLYAKPANVNDLLAILLKSLFFHTRYQILSRIFLSSYCSAWTNWTYDFNDAWNVSICYTFCFKKLVMATPNQGNESDSTDSMWHLPIKGLVRNLHEKKNWTGKSLCNTKKSAQIANRCQK